MDLTALGQHMHCAPHPKRQARRERSIFVQCGCLQPVPDHDKLGRPTLKAKRPGPASIRDIETEAPANRSAAEEAGVIACVGTKQGERRRFDAEQPGVGLKQVHPECQQREAIDAVAHQTLSNMINRNMKRSASERRLGRGLAPVVRGRVGAHRDAKIRGGPTRKERRGAKAGKWAPLSRRSK